MDAVLLLMHPDLEWLEPPEQPDRAVVKGREAALAALMLWLSNWASYENELRAITEHGEHVLVDYRQQMVGAGSQVSVAGDLFMVWTIRDGLATRMEMYLAREEAEAAAGLDQPIQ